MTIPISNNAKMQGLIELLRSFGSVAIGFSGGVDSTFLAAVSIRALPPADVHLIHLDTPFVGTPERESFERERGRFERAGAHVVAIETDPLADPDVAANPADRCYHCKRLGFRCIVDAACELGVRVVLEGSNADDAGDYRPGTRAVRELDVRSPLMETGWCKDEEREVLHAWGFDVWDLPAGACLATRIPCGEALTAEKLHTVRMCEDYLHGLGLRQVRVRIDGGMARVSVGAGENADAIVEADGRADAHPHADSKPGRLAPTVIRGLQARGCSAVDPVVHPYRHGEGNGAA
ncbi:TIGR00268: family protein [Collinsella intestinalis]|uniref:TIGR00268: family protein n=1 Tax=Collinsella intestinalis TaxID=147207 RepID=A0A5K1J4F7_9ACTN|nr:ATP-dependent sacrificial sulfur transferase LarE [Collinsella intestinalis]VWL97426.1 TIGR00268: family protein [Collinsella intestinalis]